MQAFSIAKCSASFFSVLLRFGNRIARGRKIRPLKALDVDARRLALPLPPALDETGLFQLGEELAGLLHAAAHGLLRARGGLVEIDPSEPVKLAVSLGETHTVEQQPVEQLRVGRYGTKVMSALGMR